MAESEIPAVVKNVTDSTYPETGPQGHQLPSGVDYQALAHETNMRVRDCLNDAAGWISEARTAHRYYRSDQYRRQASRKDRERVRLIANFIRRDVDRMVAEVLDGQPVVNPVGRHPKFHDLGRLLVQVLEWTRDEEEHWEADQEKVITSCFHIGEGILFEGWDQDEQDGLGAPVSRALDARHVFWDPDANRGFQRDDARYVIWIEHALVKDIEAQYPQLRGFVECETLETFLQPHLQSFYRYQNTTSASPMTGRPDAPRAEKAWIRRQWSKKDVYEKRYFYRENGLTALIEDDEGQLKPVTEDTYASLSPTEQSQLYVTHHRKTELWETVVINETVVVHRLSPYDRSRGGHGKYPFCFFSYVHLVDESHARGEIGFLVGTQDIANETVTLFLDQLFLNNVGYWQVYRGSLDPEAREQINRIGSRPNQVIETTFGIPPPEHRGTNPVGLSSAAQAIPIVKDLMDKISGVHDVDRGEIERRIQSGRAIRALQAQARILSTTVRRHIESGLRRATLLRLHNIMQFMRGTRVMQVTDPDTREEKPLYIGHSEEEVMAFYGLTPQVDEAGGKITVTDKGGKECEILVLNDDVAREVIFERVKLTLDTGQERNRLERMDQAEMVLQTVGPAAIGWAGQQLEWSNLDQLLLDMEKYNAAQQVFSQLEDVAQQMQVDVPTLVQQVLATALGAGAPGPGGGPPGVPGGPGGPGPPMPPGPRGAPARPNRMPV